MLTPKDVLYLEDLLDQTLVLNKRIANDVTMLSTPEVKTCFEDVNEKLKEHYQAMVKILEKEAKES
ncbi:oxidoreductase [[Eubacterium] hominis]|uniref:oxidoreductase n=1 Tax=[Eubacterium] hominis TaxID=2764325 RepID=UPI003A4DE267